MLKITETMRKEIREAVRLDHPCDDPACDIAFALHHDLVLWAAVLLDGATETPHLDKVMAKYGLHTRSLIKIADAECKKMAQYPHRKCENCGHVDWYDNEYEKESASYCRVCLYPFGKGAENDDAD